MRAHFPAFDPVEHEWTNIHDGIALRHQALDELLRRTIQAPEVLVEVHRKLGALLPIGEASTYIGSHLGQWQIRIADREYTSFVVIAVNGVATGWRATDNKSIESGSPTAPTHF